MKLQSSTLPETLDALSKKGTCIEFFSAYQDMDIDRMLGLCDPNSEVDFTPLGDLGKGKLYETGKKLWMALMESFPDLDNTVRSQTFNENDDSVTCFVAIFGKQEKEFLGLTNKGLRFDSDHIFIFKFDEQSKISKITITWDHERFVNFLTGC